MRIKELPQIKASNKSILQESKVGLFVVLEDIEKLGYYEKSEISSTNFLKGKLHLFSIKKGIQSI